VRRRAIERYAQAGAARELEGVPQRERSAVIETPDAVEVDHEA
jgi:hypothetical protein